MKKINKKGQALIEFIIILPVFVMIMVSVFDYVRIYNEKSMLESVIEEVIINDDYENNDVDIIKNENNYTVSKKIIIYSPLLTPFLGNNYKVSVERKLWIKMAKR